MTKKNNPVGIIGYGRFGQTLAQLLAEDFSVKIYDSIKPTTLPASIEYVDCESLLSLSTIFIAVPIRKFAETIKKIAPKLGKNTTIIDVCSVKTYPVKIMQQELPAHVGIIATHPLFGPDSIKDNHTLRMVMHSTRDVHHCFSFWKDFFATKKISIIEMLPEEHDQLAAKTQSLTHFIGRCLEKMNCTSTPIDTNGYKKLLSVMEQTCNDSFELFTDLIQFNPYSREILDKFLQTAQQLFR